MSFPTSNSHLFHIITNKNRNLCYVSFGKEEDLDYIDLSCTQEKASASTFFTWTLCGSVTVEAVICLPLFLYAAICLIWMLELRTIQIRVRCALQEAGKELAIELSEVPILLPSNLEGKIVKIIGEDRIADSPISGGINCEKSFAWPNTGVMELKAEYKVKLPVPFFRIPELKYEESMRIKIWNGYSSGGFGDGISSMEEIVYVTETGIVYHRDYHCNYLDLSIRQVSAESVEQLRNESGGKYKACVICGGHDSYQYYITDYGDKYHSSLSCMGLKRKVYAVPVSEVKGKGVCSKCG